MPTKYGGQERGALDYALAMEEIAAAFIARYGGDQEALLASARYPKVEFTFTEKEQKLAEAEMDLLVAVGQIPHKAPLSTLFSL